MDLQQTPIRAKALNQTALLNLISGLMYEPKTDTYQFKHKKYKLREVTPLNKAYNNHYFVNIVEPTEMVIVKCTNGRGLPIYDGFNDVKVDSRARHLQYLQSYYYDVRKPRTEANKPPKKVKEPVVKEPLPMKVCRQCGLEFVPVNATQEFCSGTCRKRYWSKAQAEVIKASHTTSKKCLQCGKEFTGTPRQKYCSDECRLKFNDNLRTQRREEAKKQKETPRQKKTVVVKKKQQINKY